MNRSFGPPGLLGIALVSCACVLGLALFAIITFPLAVFSASCLALYLVPPGGGMRACHYQILGALFLLCAVATYLWQRSWTWG